MKGRIYHFGGRPPIGNVAVAAGPYGRGGAHTRLLDRVGTIFYDMCYIVFSGEQFASWTRETLR